MNAIEVRDRSTNRADRYQLEAKIAGTVYDVGIANGADAIAGTSPGALVSASALGSAYAAMPPVEFARGTTTAIRVGNWVGSAAMGSAHVFAAVMDKHSDGQLDVIAAFGESPADLTSAYSAKVGRFRHVINGITANHETYGLVGQVVAKNVTFAHLHAGLMGTFEVNTAATVNSAYVYGTAGVMSRLGVGTSALTCTKDICGFSAVYNGGALVSGGAYAYGATSTTATTWGALLAADKCDNLLYAATGTAYESGVKIASITIDDADGAAGVVRVNVGGTLYFIPLYVAGDLTGE